MVGELSPSWVETRTGTGTGTGTGSGVGEEPRALYLG